MNCTPERQQIDQDFGTLQALLEETPLRTERGSFRKASAQEFMWMHEKRVVEGRLVGFKHRDSRNYVFVMWPWIPGTKELDEPKLEVPQKPDAFKRGTFDVFDVRELVGTTCVRCGGLRDARLSCDCPSKEARA